MSLLRTRGLAVARRGEEILAGVDLSLEAGEVVAVLGPNGVGKSSLLQVLGGLLAPAAGEVERAGRVALALQSPDLAARSVRANVELALAWWGVPRAGRAVRAVDALDAMRAAHLADRPAAELSGGERRRVHLARAVALRPEVLLLDEPFAGLDPSTRADILTDLGGALRAAGHATIVVVHDRAEAWALADRLLVLLDGGVAADGAPQDVLDHPPTPAVARFLGFDGELRADSRLRLTRPLHVRLATDGDRVARVARAVPLEDGVRLELALPDGRLFATAPLPGPAVGDDVRLTVTGGAEYASSDGA